MVPIETALERSLNASAAQVGTAITPNVSFNFLTQKLKFTSLLPADNNRAPMAIGGLSEGVTVREMTAGYQMFANGGKYYKPYTFYHVDDHDGNVILDNRDQTSTQAISSVTASIMHRLLNNVITGANGTGKPAAISGWEVFGKTGTTNDNKDSWFIGGTPYAIAGIWTGYLKPTHINNTSNAAATWKKIMVQYLSNKKTIKFSYDPKVVSASYSIKTGLLVNPGSNVETKTGWYDKNNMPAISDEGSVSSVLPIVSSSEASSQTLSSNAVSGSEGSGGSSSDSTETQPPVSSEPPQTSAGNSHPGKGQGADQTAHSVVPVG
jgi:penicillin-binding protein 1A